MIKLEDIVYEYNTLYWYKLEQDQVFEFCNLPKDKFDPRRGRWVKLAAQHQPHLKNIIYTKYFDEVLKSL